VRSDKGGCADELVLTNARVVMRDSMFRGTVHIVGGRIAGIDTQSSSIPSAVDLEGDFLIPGLVDIHTDNLERHLEPRPGVAWPSFAALISHDRQIAAAGVTTVFDSLCVGDQRRGIARRQAALVESLAAMERAQADGMVKSVTLLPDPGPVGKVPTDLEGCDDEADEAAVFAGVQGAGGCAPSGAWGDAGECCG
jgi:alpha-D-ribose 1-methylphosphonate 5-triphosphate diphosphatase